MTISSLRVWKPEDTNSSGAVPGGNSRFGIVGVGIGGFKETSIVSRSRRTIADQGPKERGWFYGVDVEGRQDTFRGRKQSRHGPAVAAIPCRSAAREATGGRFACHSSFWILGL